MGEALFLIELLSCVRPFFQLVMKAEALPGAIGLSSVLNIS